MTLMQYFFNVLVSPAVVQSIGWLLVHSLWQCMLVAFVAMCHAKLLRRQSSSAKYWMYSIALSLMVISPFATMFAYPPVEMLVPANGQQAALETVESAGEMPQIEGDNGNAIPLVPATADPRDATSDLKAAKPASEPGVLMTASYSLWIQATLSLWFSTIVAVWCCGVLLFSIRPIWGWLVVRRLLRTGTLPVAANVQKAMQRVCEIMQVQQRVEVLASTLVGSPIVVGCLRSVILVPASFVSNLPISQLEAILAHELAHVRRYDYLVNLLQTLVETLFFYHPAVWWLSHRIRVERENCCDDLVVAALGNRVEYGRALLAVEEFRSAALMPLALSAKGGSLSERVRRLLGNQESVSGSSATLTALGICLSIIVATGIWSSFVAVSAMTKEDSLGASGSFGVESHGMQLRLVALSPDVDVDAPRLEDVENQWSHSSAMTFGIELKNVSDEPVTLAGIRYGIGFSKEVQGTLRAEMTAPHWFAFEFTDLVGRPIPRTHREFYEHWSVADSASTHVLAPGESLTEVLKPAKFHAPMDFDLPPGKYKVRVRYHGPDEDLRENVRKYWPDKPILNAWPHEVVSNDVEFEVQQPSRRIKPEDLIWGKPIDGLQAALEYRVPDEVPGDPMVAPGVPVGTSISVVFHLKNVSDKPMTFISETGRQGDRVHVTNERGKKVDVKDVWFSGEPIDVAWRLEPGELAQLNLLTPSLNLIDQPGKFTVRYTVCFNSRIQKDDAGDVIFPRQGDFDKEVDTGDTPLFLTAAIAQTEENTAKAEKAKSQADRLSKAIPIRDVSREFADGDEVKVTQITRLPSDQEYEFEVRGSWRLASKESAVLEQWCAGGEVRGDKKLTIKKGAGEFRFQYSVIKPGQLHLSLYPIEEGNGFGSLYYEPVDATLQTELIGADGATRSTEKPVQWKDRVTPWYRLHCDESLTDDDRKLCLDANSCLQGLREEFEADRVDALLKSAEIDIFVHPRPTDNAAVGLATLKTGTKDGRYRAELHLLALSAHPAGATTNVGEPMDRNYFQKTLVHEVSTIVLERITNSKPAGWQFFDAPSWFVQGYEEYLGLKLSSKHNRTVVFEKYVDLHRDDATRVSADFTVKSDYIDGAVLVCFLHETYGKDKVQSLLMSEQLRFGSALQKVLGVDQSQLFAAWSAWLRNRGAQRRGLSGS